MYLKNKFQTKHLNMFGKFVADYLHSSGEIVLSVHPVEGIPSIAEIEKDNSSYKQVRATTRYIFDLGVIYGLAYIMLRDQEYANFQKEDAETKTEKNLSSFLKEGLTRVSKYDYELPEVYSNNEVILKYEMDSRNGGDESPFRKGAIFSHFFLTDFYKLKDLEE